MASEPFTVPVDELIGVASRVVPNCYADERAANGHVRLSLHNGRRVWDAFTGPTAVRYLGGGHPTDGPLDVLISPRLFRPAAWWHKVVRADDDGGSPFTGMRVPAVRPDGSVTGPATVWAGDIILSHPCGVGDFPDFTAWWDDWMDAAYVNVQIEASALLGAILAAADSRPSGVEFGADYPPPICYLSVSGRSVRITVDWTGFGPTVIEVATSGTDGSARVAVKPMQFADLLDAIGDAGEVTLGVPLDLGSPMIVSSARMWVAVMPYKDTMTDAELLEHVQGLLGEMGMPDAQPDGDGDLPLPFEDERLYIRIGAGSPPVAQVFAVIADLAGLADQAGVLDAVNDTNAALRHCRLFAVAGQLLLEADLPDVPDVGELRTAARHVASQAPLVRGIFPPAVGDGPAVAE